MSFGSRGAAAARGLPLLIVGAIAGCGATAPYPAPPPRTLPPLDPAGLEGEDPGDVARMRALETACRVRLSGHSAAASIAALDRVHEVLGSSCDLETIDHDPLHWRLRCRSDALFDSGKYALLTKPSRCAELGNRPASSWECVGAVLAALLDADRPDSLLSMDAAVLGHVDMTPLRPQSESHICTELHQALGYEPEPPWTAVPAEATEEERLYANNQLAWCRAASVAEAMRGGMIGGRNGGRASKSKKSAKRGPEPQGDDGEGDAAQPELPLSLAVLGVGTSWLGSQPGGACPSTGKTPEQDKDCGDARRVDLLLRFTPRSETTASSCDRNGDDAATALYCLQQCLETAAVGHLSATDTPPTTAPLFVERTTSADAGLPAGWYLKELLTGQGRTLDMARVCDALEIDAAHCPAAR